MRTTDIPYTATHGTIRFLFSRYNIMQEVDEVLKVLPGTVATLRKLSPYWDGDKPVESPEISLPTEVRIILLSMKI